METKKKNPAEVDGWNPNIEKLPAVVRKRLVRTWTQIQREQSPLITECAILRMVRDGEAVKREQALYLTDGYGTAIEKTVRYYKIVLEK